MPKVTKKQRQDSRSVEGRLLESDRALCDTRDVIGKKPRHSIGCVVPTVAIVS